MKNVIITVIVSSILFACDTKSIENESLVRSVVDTIGFVKYDWQMDSVVDRIERSFSDELTIINQKLGENNQFKVAICPHDDYTYAGYLYVPTISRVKAKTVILFGVAHKARNFDLEDKLIFDDFDSWAAPYGNIKISDLRKDIQGELPENSYVVHRKMHEIEHSLEALTPFLQYFNKDVEIIPILVPYMSYKKMNELANYFSESLKKVLKENNLNWGEDISIVVSTDAVHYGDKDWGGKNYAPYGVDSVGLAKAVEHEYEIINNALIGELTTDKILQLVNYTVSKEDYKEYIWTWCGRYSIPMGLLTAYHLNEKLEGDPLEGKFIGYANSIDHPVLQVKDLGMGATAPAEIRHWVGYVAVGY